MATKTLAVRYRPQTFDDVVEQESVKIILQQQLEAGEVKNAYLFTGPAGCGKAQPLYSKVLTPSGYINMGNVVVGTEVITRKGNSAKVTGVYPQGKKPIYEIILQDNTKIRVADNHLNIVSVYNQDKKCKQEYILTTLGLIDFMSRCRWKVRIDTPSIHCWKKSPVLIDPYLLGILIGDGSFSGNFGFCNTENDILKKVNFILKRDYEMQLSCISNSKKDFRISYINETHHNGSKGNGGQHELVRNYDVMCTLKGQLDSYGLLCKSVDKHIPKEYLFNSANIRVALLQGLFDADGHISKNGGVTFNTSSERLSEDFAFLVRSLGIRDTVKKSVGRYKKENVLVKCADAFTHHLHIPNDLQFYTSEKHSTRWRARQNEPLRNIVSINYVGEEECQCIMVDDKDHTYISDDFIPTHNTTLARIFANEINNGQGNPIEMDAASNSGVADVREISNQAKTKSLDSEYKCFIIDEAHSISNTGWQAFLKLIEEPPAKSIFLFCTTDPQKIPKTILSRVQRYDIHKISQQGIVDRLEAILMSECGVGHVGLTDSLEYISKLSEGGMRDAISLLEKCLAYSPDLTIENVVTALGTVDYDTMIHLTELLGNGQTKEVIKIVEDVYASGKDIKQFVKLYTHFLLDLTKYFIGCDWKYLQIPKTKDYEQAFKQFKKDTEDTYFSLLDTMVNLNSQIKWSQSAKYDFECALMLWMEG